MNASPCFNWRKPRNNSSTCLQNVPAACKEFDLTEQEHEAAKSREKEAARTKLYNQGAQSAVQVCPKYAYEEERIACPCSGDCFSVAVKDYLDGTFKGSQPERVELQKQILLEAVQHFFKNGGVGLTQT
jgi:hypothetical protein